MTISVLFIALLSVAAASSTGCCRGYKIFQFRRPGILPMYESSPPCGNIYGPQEDYCDDGIYPPDPLPKYEAPISRYYPSYMGPKAISHKCVCSKSIASQRIVSSVPRYYKRGYCNEPMIDAVGPCNPYGCGECGQYGQCTSCGQYGHCPQHACGMPQTLYRPPSHRVLTLPASCVC